MVFELLKLLLGSGLVYTIEITLVALAVGLLIGTPVALLRVYGGSLLRNLAQIYIVILRGFPALVVLFIVYYSLASVVNLSPFLAGCIALGVCSSAYQAEIFRGALQGVSSAQMMAARALGMTRVQAIWNVILPQALRNAIPGWSNEAAVVVKDSSLVYAVGLTDLMQRAKQINGRLHAPLLIFSVTAFIYLCLTFGTNRILDWLERKTRIPGTTETRG